MFKLRKIIFDILGFIMDRDEIKLFNMSLIGQ